MSNLTWSIIADYSLALALKPEDAAAYNNRAVAKSKLADYHGAEAEADYNRAIEIDPALKDR